MRHVAATGNTSQLVGRVRSSRRWHAVPGELAYVASGVMLYFGVRGITNASTGIATHNAHDIVSFERGLGVYVEPSMQDLVDDAHWLMTVMNWVYIWGHWPVIALTLLWLVLDHPAGYRVTRNAMLSSGAVGLVVFAIFPVAPPRLADLGLVDTVTSYSSAYRVLQPQAFVNQYAAMPSLHVGWDLLIGIALFTYSQHRALRIVGVMLPALMAISVLATANHYLVDVIAGIALVLVSRAAAQHFDRRHPRGGNTRGQNGSAPTAPRPVPVAPAHPRLPVAR